ncbi:Metabotropic GABA-B receptor subtype 3A [Geranomyces variabilis]|nr:Metabotropic GABA-B receptor subtype 3A [Geranomyces variabilis]
MLPSSPLRAVALTFLAALFGVEPPRVGAIAELRFHSVLPASFYFAQIPSIQRSLQLLADSMNTTHNLLPGATVKIYFGDSLKSKPKAIELGSQAMANKTHGVIGDFNSGTSAPLSYVLQQQGTLMCSGGSTAVEFSDKGDFPNFWRTISADDGAGKIIIDWVSSMGWQQVIILASNTAYGQGVADSAVRRALDVNISVAIRASFTSSSIIGGVPLDYSDVLTNILALKVRIIIFAGAYDEMIPMYLQAYKMGLVGNDYVWITGESSKFINGYVGTNMMQYLPLLRGLVVVYPREIQGALGEQFVANYTRLYGTPPDDYSGFYYDCLLGTLLAYDALLKHHTIEEIAMQTFPLPAMLDFIPRSYMGVTGLVALNNNSDRLAPYNIFNLKDPANDNVYTAIGYSDGNGTVYPVGSPVFFDGTSRVPPDHPPLLSADVDPHSGLVIAVYAIYSVALFCITLSIIVAFIWRGHEAIKSVSAPFCILIDFGIMMVLGSVFLNVGAPTLSTCISYVWMMSLGITVVLSSLAVKLYRLYRIFDNRILLNRRFPEGQLLKQALVLMSITISLLAAWTIGSPPTPQIREYPSRGLYVTSCTVGVGSTVWSSTVIGLLIGYNIIGSCVLAVLAFKTRNVWSQYNESRYIAVTVYNFLLISIALISVTIGLSSSDPTSVFRIRAFVILLTAMLSWYCTAGRHVFRLAMRIGGVTQPQKEDPLVTAALSQMYAPYSPEDGAIGAATFVSSLRGRFPAKIPHTVSSTWRMHALCLGGGNPGFLHFTPVTKNVGTCILLDSPDICSLRIVPESELSPLDLQHVLEIRWEKNLFWVQMDSGDTVARWHEFFEEILTPDMLVTTARPPSSASPEHSVMGAGGADSAQKCGTCEKTVYATEKIEAAGKHYHKGCFKCSDPNCNIQLNLKTFQAQNNEIWCGKHVPVPKATAVADSVSVLHAKHAPKKATEGLHKTNVGTGETPTYGLDTLGTQHALLSPKKSSENLGTVRKGGAGSGSVPRLGSKNSLTGSNRGSSTSIEQQQEHQQQDGEDEGQQQRGDQEEVVHEEIRV